MVPPWPPFLVGKSILGKAGLQREFTGLAFLPGPDSDVKRSVKGRVSLGAQKKQKTEMERKKNKLHLLSVTKYRDVHRER